MAAAVEISATPELEARDPSIQGALRRFETRLNALCADELEAVAEAATRALEQNEQSESVAMVKFGEARQFNGAERVELEIDMLMRSFEYRRKLLDGALTASQVVKLLHTSRQTPHDRLGSGTLLAAMERGDFRFPIWQFDPDGENGGVSGLPDVIRALHVAPVAKISWLRRADPMLDGETPLACLKAGEVDRVVALARAVGIA